MIYKPLSVIRINQEEADPYGQTSFDPLWGIGRAGWYMVDESGEDVFGPFEDPDEAYAELNQYIDDMGRF